VDVAQRLSCPAPFAGGRGQAGRGLPSRGPVPDRPSDLGARTDGGCDPDLPGRMGAVHRAVDLLADPQFQADDRADTRVRHKEFHGLRHDHGVGNDCPADPGSRRAGPQPIPGQRPAGGID